MSKKSTIIFYSVVCVLLAASIAVSAVTLVSQLGMKKDFAQYYGVTEDVEQEDDVMIAGEYMIKSTLNISDAYKSGDSSKLDDNDKETLDLASEILKDIIKKDMSDYDKEKAVYTWLTSKLENNTSMLTVVNNDNRKYDNPHDVLKYHQAVCVGYATTFRMMMQMLGIECKVIHSSDLTHSWDLIHLEDGWYHTDCYMDSGSATFMNFNMNDNMCAQGHEWTREYFPAADGKKFNYILSVCEEVKNIYKVPKWLTKAIADGKNAISCTFKEKITEKDEAAAQLLVDTLTESIISNPEYSNYSINSNWTQNEKSEYVLCLYISDTSEAGMSEVDDKTKDKIYKAIGDAIGSEYVVSYGEPIGGEGNYNGDENYDNAGNAKG